MENKNSMAGNQENENNGVTFTDVLSGIREAKTYLEAEARPESAAGQTEEESLQKSENSCQNDPSDSSLDNASAKKEPEESFADGTAVSSGGDEIFAEFPTESKPDSLGEILPEMPDASLPDAVSDPLPVSPLLSETLVEEDSLVQESAPEEQSAPAGEKDPVLNASLTDSHEPVSTEFPAVSESETTEEKLETGGEDSEDHVAAKDPETLHPAENDEVPEPEAAPQKKSVVGKILFVVLFLFILLGSAGVVVFQTVIPERERLEVTAEFHFLFGNYRSSETAYLKLLTGNETDDRQVLNRLLRTYAAWASSSAKACRADPGAVYASEKLLSYVSDNDEYQYDYAMNLYLVGRYEEAKKLCAALIEHDRLNREYNDLMLLISVNGGFRREEVETYFRLYEITGDEKYVRTANYMIPTAPAFSNLGGDSDHYFTLTVRSPENCRVVFTVDGSKPDGSVLFAETPPLNSSTHIYDGGLDFSYYANGKSMIVRAISVTEDGVESYETIGMYNFNIEYCPVESITLNKSEITLTEGDSFSLRPDIQPAAATNQNIVWRSSDENYVTVDDNGLVTAVNYTDNENVDVRCQTSATVDVIGKAMSENVTVVCRVTVIPERVKPTNETALSKNLLNFDLAHPVGINDNTVGWLYMEYHYAVPFLPNDPIVRAPADDPDFYRSHNIYQAQNTDGALSVPLGTNMQTLGKNTVICGNIFPLDGFTSDETGKQTAAEKEQRRLREISQYPLGGGYMFSALADLNKKPEWYLDAENHFLYLGTGYGTYVCQIFSWYKAPGFDNYDVVDFSSDEEFVTYAKSLQERNQLYNLIKYEKFEPSDCIVTLIGYKDGTPDTVVHAKIVKYRAFESGYYATASSVAESTHYVPWNIDSGTVSGTVADDGIVSDGENQTPVE